MEDASEFTLGCGVKECPECGDVPHLHFPILLLRRSRPVRGVADQDAPTSQHGTAPPVEPRLTWITVRGLSPRSNMSEYIF